MLRARALVPALAAGLLLSVAFTPAIRADDGTWSLLPVVPMQGQSVVLDTAHQRLLAFGGGDKTLFSNIVWSVSYTEPGATWTPLATIGTPPSPRTNVGLAYDSARDRLLVRGGINQYTGLDDLWALSLAGTPTWSEVVTAGTPPNSYMGESTVYDPVHDQLLVFGGYVATAINTTYALPLSGTPTWTVLSPGTLLPGRYYHGAVFDAARGRLVVFAGFGAGGALSDAWALSFDPTLQWTRLNATGPTMIGRPSLAVDPLRDRMLVLNAYQNTTAGIWSLSFGDNAWSLLPAAAPAHDAWTPLANYDAASDRLLMIGQAPLNDTWSLPLGAPLTWTPIVPSDQRPDFRSAHSTVWDEPRQRAIVYGGYGEWQSHLHPQAPMLGDVWALGSDGHWTPITPSGIVPAPRQGHTAVYDPVRQRMIVFGGRTDTETGPVTSDVWALTLAGNPVWQQLAIPGTPPPGRYGHTAIVDVANDRMIVFGGSDGASPFNDVWALPLSGTSAWQPLTPLGSAPSARWDASAVYDANRHRMLVLGGWTGEWDTKTNDLYELTLTGTPQWSAIVPPGAWPPVRYGHGAVIDPLRDRMVIFGGDQEVDMWALPLAPGSAWQSLTLSGYGSVARRYASLLFDVAGNRMISALGQTPCYGPDCWRPWDALGDAWSASFATPLAVPAPGAVASGLELATPWPMPTRGAVTLAFSLPRASSASLALYDVAGRRVLTRDLASLGAGRHTLTLPEVARLRPGIYLARLTQGGESRGARVCVMH